MGRDWVSVREFNLAMKDRCDLCESPMFPDTKIWHVETRNTEGFCCSRECAEELGIRVAHQNRSPHVDAEMARFGIATEDEYIDRRGLRPYLLPDDEVAALRKSLGLKDGKPLFPRQWEMMCLYWGVLKMRKHPVRWWLKQMVGSLRYFVMWIRRGWWQERWL